MQEARCAIYETRPDACRRYPESGDADSAPSECTYIFDHDGQRKGSCDCGVGACCAVPRVGGEPDGAALSELAGGEPCKHLIWERKLEKVGHPLLPVLNDGPSFGTRLLMEAVGGWKDN